MMTLARWMPMVLIAAGCAGAPPSAAPAPPSSPPPGPPAAADHDAPQGTSAPTGTVVVSVTGFRKGPGSSPTGDAKGQVLIAVFASKAGFPDRGKFAARRVATHITNGRARARFDHLPAGDYAIAILHDENGNFEMDTGLFGIPKEGYGASNDARGHFGPPKWKDARFTVAAGATVTQNLRITYP